uniref:NADH-ubiquinone oxidoreductase chain 2 n=3 Tax=Gromphadorhina TaxID=36952 RepID=A0A2P1H9M8_9NEOP|nr:NADH dehydrogenase subunit 2 [Gromphadorhina portentosa]AVN67467.1 NADH dehydrogenase subunit 2 [Gromphadorhina sp. B040]AVN68237.1 NADH dehydrogenase subunit 2 [Gromphadorhina sp. Pvii]
MLFLSTLIGGLVITISSNSWLGAWMGLEINLLSFIPLMTNNDNILTSEASLKYFLIQALASSSLLFIIVSKSLMESMFSLLQTPLVMMMVITPLMMKSGSAPLHWWFPSVMEGLSWNNCFILMTVQKIAPLLLMSYLISFSTFTIMIIMMSIIIGALGGYNQISMRKILTYSSINHIGWMMTAMSLGENLWLIYFFIYSLLTLTIIMIVSPMQISFINQTFMINKKKIMKFVLFSTLLSLGGLPPFLGFLPKWIIIQSLLLNHISALTLLIIVISLITLYYYLRIAYSSFLIVSSEQSWNKNCDEFNMVLFFSLILSTISTIGLVLCTAFININ